VYLLHKTVHASSPAEEATPKRLPHQLSEQTIYSSLATKPQDLGSFPGSDTVCKSSQAVSKLHCWYIAWLDPVGCKSNAQESEKEKNNECALLSTMPSSPWYNSCPLLPLFPHPPLLLNIPAPLRRKYGATNWSAFEVSSQMYGQHNSDGQNKSFLKGHFPWGSGASAEARSAQSRAS